MNEHIEHDFIESWGAMGMLWGLNRSIARIHALLIVAEDPLSLDEIAERLQVSRGNTSMSLRELRNWRIVKRVKLPGDRRDYYETEPDVWRMFFAIIGERKRREFDPVIVAVRTALRALRQDAPEGAGTRGVVNRLAQMDELLTTMERILSRFLSTEKTSRAMLKFLAGWIGDDA
jgi:DNA-binding transcriptional regulator GbsR (MarR family)